MLLKLIISFILIIQLINFSTLNGNNFNKPNYNSLKKSKQEIESKLVSAYIDFADILRENESKVNKTIDNKLENLNEKFEQKFDRMINKLDRLGRLSKFLIYISLFCNLN